MLELSALGLLQWQPLHGYRLKQQLELFMSSCISVNYGAIYPLLKRLQERGEISVIAEAAGDAGNPRKIYEITALGRDRWREKMLEHPQESWVNSRSRFQIKFFFFGDLEPQERIKLLEQRLRVCYLRQDYLESQQAEHDNAVDSYQAASWQRCTDTLQLEIQWLTEQLAQEQSAIGS
ncbi:MULTISPECIES: PadR family transcriptional regulator [unclassified Microcoleus]|uniref:PadR family transcriptional regulator n=1 Tax=unclassified Microcoleus TaxID=2642155 RepID=UPI002FCF66FF